MAVFGQVRQSLSITSLGFRTLLSTAKCYRFSATLNTAVSGVITPAGSAQTMGHAPRIAIPTYTCALPVGEIDPGYRLGLSETERSLPVRNHIGFKYKASSLFLSTARINSRRQLSYESARFIGDTSGNTTQAKHSRTL